MEDLSHSRYTTVEVWMRKILFLLQAFFLAACSPATLEDLASQGEAETRLLAEELHRIETKEELKRRLPRLRKRYNRIAKLLIDLRKFSNPPPVEPTLASEKLFIELARLYEIPGAREIIESAESEAVHRLSVAK